VPSNIVSAELVWTKDLIFGATSGESALIVDGDSSAGASPVQLLVFGLAGCMAMDVIDILRKGRHPVRAFRVSLTGERCPNPPRRLLTVSLIFHVHGTVPEDAVERAIGLSRDKYCSVWHSMRQDIEMRTSHDIVPEGHAPSAERTPQDSG
jgi:putative redox protein